MRTHPNIPEGGHPQQLLGEFRAATVLASSRRDELPEGTHGAGYPSGLSACPDANSLS